MGKLKIILLYTLSLHTLSQAKSSLEISLESLTNALINLKEKIAVAPVRPTVVIAEYNETRDKQKIVALYKEFEDILQGTRETYTPCKTEQDIEEQEIENEYDEFEKILQNKKLSRTGPEVYIKTILVNNTPIGFSVSYLEQKPTETNQNGYILYIAIDSSYQGKGYAKILLQETVNELKKKEPSITYTQINTETDNQNADKAYTRFGFKKVGCFKGLNFYHYHY